MESCCEPLINTETPRACPSTGVWGSFVASGYHGAMASFTLDGRTYEYVRPDSGHQPEDAKSWEYGKRPRVMAVGGTVDVYAHAERWNPSHILVSWADDDLNVHWAWVPAGNVRRVTDSEWDIEEYRHCPEGLRRVQWGNRLPGFLPA